jgi:HlyD family secretion protein
MAEHLDPQKIELPAGMPPSLRHEPRAPPSRPVKNGALEKKRARQRWLKRLLGLALVLGLVGAIVWAAMPTPIPVDAGRVERGPMRVTVDEDGMTRVKDRYVVVAPQSGELERISLEAGDSVTAGQVVARIQPPEPTLLDVRSRSEAQSRVATAQAALQKAKAAVVETRANRELARQELARNQKLATTGAATRQELDRAKFAMQSAESQLEAAQFAVRQAQGELQQAQAVLARLSGDTSKNVPPLEVRTPASGKVLKVNRQSAGAVKQGDALIEVGDPSRLEIVTDVLTSDAVHIKPGAPVLIERWGGDRPLKGHVDHIEPSAFTRTSALGVDEQRVNVITQIDDPRDRWSSLGDAFRVETSVTVWEGGDVLQAPASSVFRKGQGWATYKVMGGRAHLQSVEVGRRNPQVVQITGGLQQGDRVVLYPSDQLKDGGRVVLR